MSDRDFLLTKVEVINKVEQLLALTRKEIQEALSNIDFHFSSEMNLSAGKISKGENYRNLPYLVLDYPASFHKQNIFAYRTMFWWGNFFSSTLHLQGESLDLYRRRLIDTIDFLKDKGLFVSVGDTPWHYHYDANNYALIGKEHIEHLSTATFIKLSKRMELVEWESVPQMATENLKFLLNLLH